MTILPGCHETITETKTNNQSSISINSSLDETANQEPVEENVKNENSSNNDEEANHTEATEVDSESETKVETAEWFDMIYELDNVVDDDYYPYRVSFNQKDVKYIEFVIDESNIEEFMNCDTQNIVLLDFQTDNAIRIGVMNLRFNEKEYILIDFDTVKQDFLDSEVDRQIKGENVDIVIDENNNIMTDSIPSELFDLYKVIRIEQLMTTRKDIDYLIEMCGGYDEGNSVISYSTTLYDWYMNTSLYDWSIDSSIEDEVFSDLGLIRGYTTYYFCEYFDLKLEIVYYNEQIAEQTEVYMRSDSYSISSTYKPYDNFWIYIYPVEHNILGINGVLVSGPDSEAMSIAQPSSNDMSLETKRNYNWDDYEWETHFYDNTNGTYHAYTDNDVLFSTEKFLEIENYLYREDFE